MLSPVAVEHRSAEVADNAVVVGTEAVGGSSTAVGSTLWRFVTRGPSVPSARG